MSAGPFMYPSVTSLPGQGGVAPAERESRIRKPDGKPGEFDQIFERQLDMEKVREPLKFSAHASQRLMERKINLDQETMSKVNDAIDKAAAKGVEDTLVLTGDAALIVSVKNRTVITALDRNSMSGNVFTNIDGAVIV